MHQERSQESGFQLSKKPKWNPNGARMEPNFSQKGTQMEPAGSQHLPAIFKIYMYQTPQSEWTTIMAIMRVSEITQIRKYQNQV